MTLLFSTSALADCKLPARPKAYSFKFKETSYDVFEAPKSSLSGSSQGADFKYLKQFQNKVLRKTSVNPYELLRRQMPFFASFPEEATKFDILLNNKAGLIRSSSCLEAYLLDNHLRSFPDETEYSAFVLTRFLSSKIKVIIYTQQDKGTQSTAPIQKIVAQLKSQGWKLHSHIHNHPFFFTNPYGDIAGTILPSSADFQTYKNLYATDALKEGVVNNGFNTFVLRNFEFHLF